jgi:alpha-L-fucosidase
MKIINPSQKLPGVFYSYGCTKVLSLLCLLLILSFSGIKAQPYQASWESLDKRPIPAWFGAAKFGIFIHWGVYSVPAYRPLGKERYASYAEWYQVDVMNKPGPGRQFHDKNYGKDFTYRQFAPLFKAELFDPNFWADIFKRSGARYVVLTSKHHDGYCLWPTKSPYSKNWNSVENGPGRDLVGEISNAVRAKGLKMGLYYSLLEWETNTKGAKEGSYYVDQTAVETYRIPEDKYIDAHIMPQLKELVTNYKPAVIFSDGAWDHTSDYWKSKEFLSWLYNNAPNKDEVVVNDRWGKDTHEKHGDYFTSEYASNDDKMDASHPWEENQGVGGSYGYNRAENIEDYKTSKQLIHLLIDRVSRGGNLLLNVGPSADGRIPELMQERLLDIGNWLSVNGEAIYDTRAWKPASLNKDSTVFFTEKNKSVYAICTKWPAKPLSVKGVSGKQLSVQLLENKIPVKSVVKDGMLVIYPPVFSPEKINNAHAYVFKITGF